VLRLTEEGDVGLDADLDVRRVGAIARDVAVPLAGEAAGEARELALLERERAASKTVISSDRAVTSSLSARGSPAAGAGGEESVDVLVAVLVAIAADVHGAVCLVAARAVLRRLVDGAPERVEEALDALKVTRGRLSKHARSRSDGRAPEPALGAPSARSW